MELNPESVINDLLEQNKSLNYQVTMMRVGINQANQVMEQVVQENAQLKAHIEAFENQARAKALAAIDEAEEAD